MYYEEDMIDWGDGWEDDEDGERIPVLALDGTKSASLHKKCEEEALNAHTSGNESQAESSCDTLTSANEQDDDHTGNDEQSDPTSFDAVVEETCKNSSPKQEPSWSDPIESDLVARMTSGPPLRPRRDNDVRRRDRSKSPSPNAQRASRYSIPLQPVHSRNHGHYNPRFYVGTVQQPSSGFQSMSNELY
ncbi:uncharacterized protein FA14DRAFT_157917 [Meira miltonrushii]|uniref:Uncharacterized protein n=1 Tax=Meira miltonrushii TaxID=1280837 RepID=A0A316V4N2_9BASI|nr:uncharacterized protein FA14DRAFT_157917 [Meira miltonrushii]PWN31978.1 hypothetical protein FA14DRAFT_157917 [Meira miltonrushii]